MNEARGILVMGILLGLLTVMPAGCIGGDDDDPIIIPPPPPDWDIWTNPGLVLYLDETDPSGDNVYGDSTADLTLMQGTCDDDYVYIHLDVFSSPVIDETGDTLYGLAIDGNNTGDLDPGDYYIAWDGLGGFMALNYYGLPVSGAEFQLNPSGGIDFAIPRRLVNQTAFGVSGATMYWVTAWEDADDMPPYPAWAPFTF